MSVVVVVVAAVVVVVLVVVLVVVFLFLLSAGYKLSCVLRAHPGSTGPAHPHQRQR